MFKLNKLFSLLILLFISSSVLIAQDKDKKDKKQIPQGTPVMWESVDIPSRNLLLGPGGAEMRPDISKIEFIKDEKGGYSTKYRIRDGAGRVWVAKISKESQSETAAVRLLWALGYKSEINYLIPELTIPGKGTFKNVRLEARPEDIDRVAEWQWKTNPFIGTKEYQGLKVMMAFLNNWDLKDSNNQILVVKNSDDNQLHYIISDLGATLGKTGGFIVRSRNKPEDYEKSKFIKEIEGNLIDFNYGGKMLALFEDITIEDARWVANLLSQLKDEQIRDAFRAANYTDEEVDGLTQAVKYRIAELNRVTGLSAVEGKRDEK